MVTIHEMQLMLLLILVVGDDAEVVGDDDVLLILPFKMRWTFCGLLCHALCVCLVSYVLCLMF